MKSVAQVLLGTLLLVGSASRGLGLSVSGTPASWTAANRKALNPDNAVPLLMDAIIAKTATSGAGRPCHRPFTQRCIIEMLVEEQREHDPATLPLSGKRQFGVNTNRIQTAIRTEKVSEQHGMIRELIAGGADVNTQPKAFHGASPLMLAASMGDVASMQILLSAGASPEAQSETGLAAQTSALMLAAGQGHDDAVRLLLEHGADASRVGLIRLGHAVGHASPLMWAAMMPSVRTLRLLAEAGADINRRFSNGETLLTWFARHGSIASVQALIQAGARVNVVDKRGRTPLMHARTRADEQGRAISEMLIEIGVDTPRSGGGGGGGGTPVMSPRFSSAQAIRRDGMTAHDVSALGVVALALAVGSHSRGARGGKQKRPLSPRAAKARKIAAAFAFETTPASQDGGGGGRRCAHGDKSAPNHHLPSPQPPQKPPPPKRQRPMVRSLALTECALSSSGWSSESHSASDVRRWTCGQVSMWAAAAVPEAVATYVMRIVDGAQIDGKALCALNCARTTALLMQGNAGLSCPMSRDGAADVAKCLLDRRNALLGAETASAKAQPAPDRFFCSLTLEVMKDPVRVCTGQVYEREEITQWLRCNLTPRCPNTNVVLKSKALVADPELKAEIDAWRATAGAAP
eukprot:COSAG02_NODE_198_length_29564_cov_12.279009_18_plen_634_part_00